MGDWYAGPGREGVRSILADPGEQARVPGPSNWPPDQGPAELSEVLILPTLGLSLVLLLREVWETGLSFRACSVPGDLGHLASPHSSDEFILGVVAG